MVGTFIGMICLVTITPIITNLALQFTSAVLNLSRFDLLVLFIFGIIGYALEEMGYPSAAIILGVILGKLLDENIRRTLMLNKGSLITLFTRPIALLFSLAILYTIIGPFVSKKIKNKFKDITENAAD